MPRASERPAGAKSKRYVIGVDPEDPTIPLTKELVKTRLSEYGEEYRTLAQEARSGSSGAQSRRTELAKHMRQLTQWLTANEPMVTVQLPVARQSKEGWRVGNLVYGPGQHTVPASVAQHLLYMVDACRRGELALYQNNGEDIDLKSIGDRAARVDAL